MTKDVLVRISGRHTEDVTETSGEGTYYFKNNKHYVLLEETQEGVQSVTKTTIRWQEKGPLEVTRKGLLNTHMIFEQGVKQRCPYGTPYGQFDVHIFTKELYVDMREGEFLLFAKYLLEVENETFADSQIRIAIQPII